MPEHPLEFDTRTMRRLVTIDRLLHYTVIRHADDSEEDWLRLVFTLEVRPDPGLSARYRALSCAA
jgi:hypothetical protein